MACQLHDAVHKPGAGPHLAQTQFQGRALGLLALRDDELDLADVIERQGEEGTRKRSGETENTKTLF